jgi:hypothetical protein
MLRSSDNLPHAAFPPPAVKYYVRASIVHSTVQLPIAKIKCERGIDGQVRSTYPVQEERIFEFRRANRAEKVTPKLQAAQMAK